MDSENGGEGVNRRSMPRRGFLALTGSAVAVTAISGTAAAAPAGPGPVERAEPSGAGRQRQNEAARVRRDAAEAERNLPLVEHRTNGDEERYPSRIGNFTKALPHNDLGEVDPAAYAALLAAVEAGDRQALAAVPLGTPGGLRLVNPLGGSAYNISGPDPRAVAFRTPAGFATAETAAEMVDVYWMALCRDIPFSAWNTDPTIAAASDDLSALADHPGPREGGRITPRTMFRLPFPGVSDGPFVSQFLLQPYRFNGVAITQRVRVPQPGQDFLVRYADWLSRLRGGAPVGTLQFDPTPRFYRNMRDLGQSTAQDHIYSPYFGAALILLGYGAAAVDDGNPYKAPGNQSGNVTFGLPHLLGSLASVAQCERHAFYQKWQVHRRIRPDYYSGRVHNQLKGAATYPLHPQLLASAALPRIAAANQAASGEESWLLPMMGPEGSPAHPGFVSGHATNAGACVTMLKAWFKEDFAIPNPVKPNADGTALEPYVAGVDGPPLTVGGELNKLASNVGLGRGMTGVHFWSDTSAGVLAGEEIAVRTLREERTGLPERDAVLGFRRFDGTPGGA